MLYIYGIVLTIWQYFTPIFWNMEMLPESYRFVFKFNPIYQFLNSLREIILYSKFPGWTNLVICGFIGVATFGIGCMIFRKSQDKFIYYS